jgi:DNA-binding MarR family transcriptional regulator
VIDAEMTGACFANRLRATSRAITRYYDATLKPLDLRVSQLSVLAAVSIGKGTLTIVELASQLAMDRSTLSRNLDPLERRGLVELGPETRHRARKVALTEAGAVMLQQAYPLWRTAQSEMASLMPGLADTARHLDVIVQRFQA